jgi:hypothetical protein
MNRTAALLVPALALVAASAAGAEGKADKDVRRSVVRVLATPRVPNVLKPWLKQSPREVYGSRVVIDGNRERSATGRPRAFWGAEEFFRFPCPLRRLFWHYLWGA